MKKQTESKTKKSILDMVMYLFLLCFLCAVLILIFFVAKKTERVEIITPEEGVKCVVVSRLFNTSIDCWKE